MKLSEDQIQELLEWFVTSSETRERWDDRRKKALEENHKWIQPDVIRRMSDEELERKFVEYYKTGGGKQTLNQVFRERIIRDKRRFRETMLYLLDEGIDIEERVNRILDGEYHIEGFGRALLTSLLMDYKPDKYCLWNNKTEKGFSVIGWELYERGDSTGTRYLKVLDALKRLKDLRPELSLTFDDIDLFLHTISAEEEGQEAVRMIIEGKGQISILQRYFVGQGFQFTSHQLATFYTALKTKGFVILSGLSGTGKTKLAQLFADLMPSLEVETLEEPEISEVDIRIQVQPYMLKYARMIIPKGYWKLIDVPPAGETVEIEVYFSERKQKCRFGHAAYAGTDYLGLYFRGQVRKWFVSSFQEGDTVAVEPIIDEEEGNFIGFRLSRPKARWVTKREENSRFVPVRPDWHDSKSLLGYYNPLSGEFESTEFLRFLLRACDNYRSSLYELHWEADHPDATTLLTEPKAFDTERARLGLIASDAGGRIVAEGAFEFHVNEGRQLSLPGRMSDLEPFRGAAKIYALELDRVYPHFVILDEMNLARVEYYFADFLSVLESGRSADGWTKEAIALHDFRSPVEDADGNRIPAQIRLPPNLYFAGTVNVDETTYMFSPKVLDRAFTLEFAEVDFTDYPAETGRELLEGELETLRQQLLKDFTRDGRFAVVDKGTIAEFAVRYPEYREHLESLKMLLQPYDLHFAYRVFDEVTAFLANAEGSPVLAGFTDLDDAFDTSVLMKVLPKFHGPRGKLESPLLKVLGWALNPDAPKARTEDLERGVKDEKKRLDLIKEMRALLGMRMTGAAEPTEGAPVRAADFAYPRTALKALRMLHALYTTGFASFA